ncbi:MAG TPA: alpha/beta fold hydrolase [Actinomycetota bacterium]
MREFPIYVPLDGDHIAAVVTVPEERPRGMVALLQGLGSGRSHRYQLWTRAAHELADRGIASVRMDYREMGDSTGLISGTLNDPPVEEILEVIRVGLRALDLPTCAVVGNCMGGRAALRVAQELGDCEAVGVIVTDNPQNYVGRAREAAMHASKAKRLARKIERRITRGRRHHERHEHIPIQWIPEIPATLGVHPMLLMYVGPERFARPLQVDATALIRSTKTPATMISFQTIVADTLHLDFPIEVQAELLDRVVRWLDDEVPWRVSVGERKQTA